MTFPSIPPTTPVVQTTGNGVTQPTAKPTAPPVTEPRPKAVADTAVTVVIGKAVPKMTLSGPEPWLSQAKLNALAADIGTAKKTVEWSAPNLDEGVVYDALLKAATNGVKVHLQFPTIAKVVEAVNDARGEITIAVRATPPQVLAEAIAKAEARGVIVEKLPMMSHEAADRLKKAGVVFELLNDADPCLRTDRHTNEPNLLIDNVNP